MKKNKDPQKKVVPEDEIRHFVVFAEPDPTGVNNYSKEIHIVVNGCAGSRKNIILDYLYSRYGSSVHYVNGEPVAPMWGDICPSSIAGYSEALTRQGACGHEVELVVLKKEKDTCGKSDNINHPTHYTSHPSGVECIEITQHHNFCIGNVIKYVWRAGIKGEDTKIEDLKKARWYLDREIARLEDQK